MTTDEQYMLRCLQLAQLGEYDVAPNPMVGAVLVGPDGQILAEGWHKRYGGPHAEVNCFQEAEAKGITPDEVHQSTLYVSLEPCSHYGKTPPCALLLQQRHPKRVVCGMLDPNPNVSGRGIQMCQEAGIEVTCGVLETACRELNKRFLMLHEHHRPYIILKWAQTADGYLDNRAPQEGSQPAIDKPLVISTPLTKQLVHKMRAENMAILIGSGTALADNPKLRTTRWTGRNPIRILLDRRGRVPQSACLMQDKEENSDYSGHPRTLVFQGNNLDELCTWLAARNIHSVLVEGGREILCSFLREGLWDEVHIEVNPHQFATHGTLAPSFELRGKVSATTDGNLIYTIKALKS